MSKVVNVRCPVCSASNKYGEAMCGLRCRKCKTLLVKAENGRG